MVVAAGAAESQAQKSPADRIDLLVDDVHLHLHRVILGQHFRAEGQEAGRDQALMAFGIAGRVGQQVAGDLLADELVVGLVDVEGVNHVVAIAIGVDVRQVFILPVGIGIAGHVEPMPAPPLAILRSGQQSIHQSRESVGGVVGEKGIDLGRRRRQAEQVKLRTAQQGALLRRRRRRDAGRLEPRQDETIERAGTPSRVFHLGQRRVRHGGKGPRRGTLPLGVDGPGVVSGAGGVGRGPRQAFAHPASERGNLTLRKFALWGHFDIARVTDERHQPALFGITGRG